MVKLLVYRCSYFFYRQVVEFMRYSWNVKYKINVKLKEHNFLFHIPYYLTYGLVMFRMDIS